MTMLSRIYYVTGEFHAKRKGHQLNQSKIFYPWDTNSLNLILDCYIKTDEENFLVFIS